MNLDRDDRGIVRGMSVRISICRADPSANSCAIAIVTTPSTDLNLDPLDRRRVSGGVGADLRGSSAAVDLRHLEDPGTHPAVALNENDAPLR